MTSRLLTPNERMTDAFDRASTLNFTTVAHVSGSTTAAALRTALTRLEQRHPLLRAGIERTRHRSRFVAGGAAPILLVVLDGARDDWHACAERTLQHRVWQDNGPRAELIYLREGPDAFTLLLCLHHVVGDGSSGVLAMRDLLGFLGGTASSSEPVPSPGTTAFFPRSHGGLSSYLRALGMLVRSSLATRPRRLHKDNNAPFEERRVKLSRFVLSRQDSLGLAQRARRARATVHGVLCAATAQAVNEQLGHDESAQRLLHPVCLRRYLRSLDPNASSPGDAVGCYVSSVETDHVVRSDRALSALAHEVTSAVQRKKAEGIPLLTAPIAGPLLTDRFAAKPPSALRELAEGRLMLNTFSLTNLGHVEQLQVRESLGELRLDDIFFIAAGSVLGQLGASVTSYRGELSYQLASVTPLIEPAQASAIVSRVHTSLVDYARSADD